jgi:hypothetical protein
MNALATVRAGWWGLRARRQARRQLARRGLDAVRLKPPPKLPPDAEAGVLLALRFQKQSCLVRATVLQEWFASQGARRDIVIGVTAPNSGFEAHAWLDGDPPCHSEGFQELLRQPARR